MGESLIFREATIADIPQMHAIRTSVRENMLSDPGRITYADYASFLTIHGKGWVCEGQDKLLGFAIIDEADANIWALFVHPDAEGRGIGKQLHNMMLNWHYSQYDKALWLSTSPNTRAARSEERRVGKEC